MDTLKGTFKRYIYKSDKGYVIGLFKVKEATGEDLTFYVNHTITFTGYFHELNEDDTYLFYGKLVEHEKYGEQFQVDSYERVLPEEKDAIVEFLSSGLFKGIGEKTAEKIVSYLGKDTLTIILENPSDLLLIPGITKKQIDNLHRTLEEYEASYQTVLKLNELGFSTKDSLVIYNVYKQKTLDILEQNIYLLMEDIDEISFKKVDTIFLKQEGKRDDPRRIMAAILYVIDEVCNLYGHSYLSLLDIHGYVVRALGNDIAPSELSSALEKLLNDMKIILEDDHYYLRKMYDAEQNISKRCGYLMRKADFLEKKMDTYLKDVEAHFSCIYNEEQIEAIRKALEKNILIVTGGPGTGKTTIIKLLLRFYEPQSGEILLGGKSIKCYPLEELHNMFGVCFQDVNHYSLSLRENIAISDIRRKSDDEAVYLAAQASGADRIIETLENGLDTDMTRKFNDKGAELSGGQWQKVALARAFFRDSQFVILDEPSSALDPEAEDYIFSSFKRLCKNKGGILVSHRLSSIMMVDEIFLLDDGAVIESGTHAELMKQDGKYAQMYRMQAEKYTGGADHE